MRIDNSMYGILYDAMIYTKGDYNIKWFDKDLFEGYIDEDDLLTLIEDLCYEIDKYKCELEELQNDIKDNYRPLSVEEQVEIYDHDFI